MDFNLTTLLVYAASGPTDEDQLYESYIVETNMVYRVDQNKLIAYEEYWGMQPPYEMLKKDEVSESA